MQEAIRKLHALKCARIRGTNNIHWSHISGGSLQVPECTAIEFNDKKIFGTVALYTGIGVSDSRCIANDKYAFSLSYDGLKLTGFSFRGEVEISWERDFADSRCFSGIVVESGYTYRGFIDGNIFQKRIG